MLCTQLAALALAATTLAAAGCGGSSKSTSTSASTDTTPTATNASTAASTTTSTPTVIVATGKPLTRAQWIAKGDAICARLNAELDASPVKTIAEFARALPQAAAYERGELTQLSKLVPPASARSSWQQFLAETGKWAENSARLGESAQTTSFNPTSALAVETEKIHMHLALMAKHEGFKECSVV